MSASHHHSGAEPVAIKSVGTSSTLSGKKHMRFSTVDGDNDKIGEMNGIPLVKISKKDESSTANHTLATITTIKPPSAVMNQTQTTMEYPYEVFSDDHCETPVEAYADIAPVLKSVARMLNKEPKDLRIYDPFYCEGSVISRLGELGFASVYNVKEDFYAVKLNNAFPEFDVLLTNPPYSQDHMEQLLEFCVSLSKPWFLLIPNYVYMKDYYSAIMSRSGITPFYVAPTGYRYLYSTPKGRRQEKSSKYTSPFPTFWFCHLGRYQSKLLNKLPAALAAEVNSRKASAAAAGANALASVKRGLALAKRIVDIPIEVCSDNDPRKKKLKNNAKRAKNKLRKKGKGGDTV